MQEITIKDEFIKLGQALNLKFFQHWGMGHGKRSCCSLSRGNPSS